MLCGETLGVDVLTYTGQRRCCGNKERISAVLEGEDAKISSISVIYGTVVAA